MKSVLRWDWDAIAGIVAAVAALVLHFLHVIETEILIMISLVLIALLFLRDLRREQADEEIIETARRTENKIERLSADVKPTEAVLVGPRDLREATEQFSRQARGTMTWFHVCLMMFKPQPLFDTMLAPALENDAVDEVRFILDRSERDRWENQVLPKARETSGVGTLAEPVWCDLDESVSFILSDQEASGNLEALLSFWGDPFMAYITDHQVPRYIFHIQSHSDLIEQLNEMEREYRLG